MSLCLKKSSFFDYRHILPPPSNSAVTIPSGDRTVSTSSYSRNNIRDVYPTGFHNLPVKVLLNVFGYSTQEELRKFIMLVCRHWKNVASLPELWQRWEFKGYKIPTNFMLQKLRILSNLQSVQLFKITDAVPVIRQLCRCNTQLTSVGIKECSQYQPEGKLPENVLRNLIASCTKLQEIDLKGTEFSGDRFYIEMAVLPKLKSVNLSKNRYFQRKNFLELALNCRGLEELKVTNIYKDQNLKDGDLQYIFFNLRSSLSSLSFDGVGLSDMVFKAILECSNLYKLALCNAMNMAPDTFVSIGQKLENLQYLKLQRVTVPPEAYVIMFVLGYENLRNITVLNLSDCWRMDSIGLRALAECCNNLEKLVLRSCREIVDIQPILKNCKKINILNIAFCRKVDIDSISLIPKELPELKYFYIELPNEERRKCLEKMKREHPKLEIYLCLSEFNKCTEEFVL